MTPNERRNFRGQRDHRLNRAWWAFFLLGCLGVGGSANNVDDSPVFPWLILAGLISMILWRRQHAQRVAQADALEDLEAAKAARAEATKETEANRTAEQRASAAQDDCHHPPGS